MNLPENYLEINKQLWNERTKHHMKSAFYNHDAFKKGISSLNEIEINLLGDVLDKSILHLQCHFGQDTLSLARMGAKVTGVDFSEEAITAANKLTNKLNLNARFICCDIYDFPQYCNDQFDIVFTTYGTVGWLPDLEKWANLISRSLKKGGTFIFVEFHPIVWMFDNEFNKFQYSYFKKDPIIEVEVGTYADKNASLALTSVGWNHSIDEVLQNLLDQDLHLINFKEYDYSPYNVFPEMLEVQPKQFQFKNLKGVLPLVYSLKMTK